MLTHQVAFQGSLTAFSLRGAHLTWVCSFACNVSWRRWWPWWSWWSPRWGGGWGGWWDGSIETLWTTSLPLTWSQGHRQTCWKPKWHKILFLKSPTSKRQCTPCVHHGPARNCPLRPEIQKWFKYHCRYNVTINDVTINCHQNHISLYCSDFFTLYNLHIVQYQSTNYHMTMNHLPARQAAPPGPTAARLSLAHHPRVLPLVVLVVVRAHLLPRINHRWMIWKLPWRCYLAQATYLAGLEKSWKIIVPLLYQIQKL